MKKINIFITALTTAFILIAGNLSTTAQTAGAKAAADTIDISKMQRTIEGINKNFAKDFNNADSTALSDYYAEDGTLGSVKGKEKIIHALGNMIRSSVKKGAPIVEFVTNSLSGDGEYLAELGVYKFLDSNNNVKSQGKYLVVWKQENGKWKIYRDIGL